MSGRLGCAQSYQAVLHTAGGGRVLSGFERVRSVEWERRLSGQSAATVTLAKVGLSRACCGALAVVAPFAHELSVYRDGELVWQGPVWRPVETQGSYTIEARDVTAWLDRWPALPDKPYPGSGWYTWQPQPPAHLGPGEAVALFETQMADVKRYLDRLRNYDVIADPALFATVTYVHGTQLDEVDVGAQDSLLKLLDNLADTTVDYTTVGRRLVVMPAGHSYGGAPVGRLSADQLGGDVEVGPDGESLRTVVWAGMRDDADVWRSKRATASGGWPFYGFVWGAMSADQVEDQAVMQGLVRLELDRAFPAPVVVRVPDDASLSPDAPVRVAELVCGARIDVSLVEGWCRPMAAVTRLAGVSGVWDAESEVGEQVAVSLVTLATNPIDDTPVEPPPIPDFEMEGVSGATPTTPGAV